MHILLFGYEKFHYGLHPTVKLFGIFEEYVDMLNRISKIKGTEDIKTKIPSLPNNVIHTNIHVFWWKVADDITELCIATDNS